MSGRQKRRRNKHVKKERASKHQRVECRMKINPKFRDELRVIFIEEDNLDFFTYAALVSGLLLLVSLLIYAIS